VQLEEIESPENIFQNYSYFSSYSSTWLKHCQDYVNEMVSRFDLTSNSQVVEIASNDGGLLNFFDAEYIFERNHHEFSALQHQTSLAHDD